MEGLLSGNLLSKASVFGSSGSNIKSVQRGTVSMSGLTTVDVTISPIDTTKSVVRQTSANSASGANGLLSSAIILNSTTIRFTHPASVGTVYPVDWEVIEFNNVKSKQTGTVQITGGNSSVSPTISNFDPLKSLLFYSYITDSPALDNNSFPTGYITSSTTLYFKRTNTSAYYLTMYFQVIEFN